MGLDVWSCERTDTEVYPNIRTKSEKFKEKLLLFLSRSLSDRSTELSFNQGVCFYGILTSG
jgi:hypothetical protein